MSIVKPHSVVLHPYRSLDDFYSIEVRPLTVVFGRNNAGKSNTLRAVAGLLNGTFSPDPAHDAVWNQSGSDYGSGRFWVHAPEDGTAWDQSLRRDIYSTWVAAEVKSRLGRRQISEDIQQLLDGLAEKPLDELAWLIVHLESSYSGTDPLELTVGLPERTPACLAFRELLRQCLIAFTPGSIECGFPESVLDPELVGFVAEAATEFIVIAPEDWDVGMSYHSETAVLLTAGSRYPLSRLKPSLVSADWDAESLPSEIERFISSTVCRDETSESWPSWVRVSRPWLLLNRDAGGYRYNPSVLTLAQELRELTNRFLPSFVNGRVDVEVTSACLWDQGFPRVLVKFYEHGRDECAGYLSEEGSGITRWTAMALRLAMQVLKNQVTGRADGVPNQRLLDGYVIMLDEPEAHLHPAAVRDVVEWCNATSDLGACIFVATHHEEFLSKVRPDAALIHVTKPDRPTASRLRQVDMRTVPDLKKLAEDIGISAGVAFGLYNAILYVEGPLDVVVLDEFAGRRLEAAGVVLVPIHGTRNLEGLVTSEVIQHLGCKQGLLLDATDVSTIKERPNKKLSTEEKKVLKVLEIARKQDRVDPQLFGIAVRDLLYSCDEDGLRDFGDAAFPGWSAIDKEARSHFGVDGSQSVNWKRYIHERYRIPFETEDGVREVIRWLDLHGYPNPAVETLVDQVIAWATSPAVEQSAGIPL